MEHTFWHKQQLNKPLYDDILWAKPENKAQAGKLLIIGGNSNTFASVAQCYKIALKAGAGSVKILLPDVLLKTLGQVLPDVEFAPSTPSGSFAKSALDAWLMHSNWADTVLIPGDLGRNSETAILLESFLKKYNGILTLARDSVDYFRDHPFALLGRQNTLSVLSFADLQKLAINSSYKQAFTFDMGLVRFVEVMHDFTKEYIHTCVVQYRKNIIFAHKGEVVTTDLGAEPASWRAEMASKASVSWMHHPAKPLEAIASSIY